MISFFYPHVLHTPPIHLPSCDSVYQRNFQVIFEIRAICLPCRGSLPLRFHLSCNHLMSLYYSCVFYTTSCLLESVLSHYVCPKWYNPTHFISRAHVVIPGNLSVLSSGIVILWIIGHNILCIISRWSEFTLCLLVWMRLCKMLNRPGDVSSLLLCGS
jgi:hypothetical protein